MCSYTRSDRLTWGQFTAFLICLLLCLAGAISSLVTTLDVMICSVCKDGLEGMWDPSRSERLSLLQDFLAMGGTTVVSPSQREHFLPPYCVECFMAMGYFKDSTADLMHHVADVYVYRHHKHRDSLLASIREGCGICSSLRDYIHKEDRQLENLDCFSVFHVEPGEPRMWVRMGYSEYLFRFLPLGKTYLAITPRKLEGSTYL